MDWEPTESCKSEAQGGYVMEELSPCQGELSPEAEV